MAFDKSVPYTVTLLRLPSKALLHSSFLFFPFLFAVPKVRIFGDKDIYVKDLSTVQLKCVVSQSLVAPTYIEWRHNNKRIQVLALIDSTSSGLATNSFFSVSFKKSFICLEGGKSMTPGWEMTIFFRSSQQLPCLRVRTLTGFLS